MGAVTLAGGDGERLGVRHDLLGACQVARVGASLDLAADSHPVLLEGVEALDDRLHPKALTGVSDLLATQPPDPALDILAGDERFDLLDTEEVLLVERAETLDARLQLFDLSV